MKKQIFKRQNIAQLHKKKYLAREKREFMGAMLFLLPSLLGVCYFVLFPLGDAVRRSFFDAMGNHFVGCENYRSVFKNTAFQLAAANTARFIGVCIPVLIGLSIARVTTVYPSQATISDKVKLSGTITAADKISVPALYGFPVKEIIGNIGGNIEAGETILQFEIEPLQEAIQLKKAELLKLQAELQAESVSQEGTDELERQIEENQLDAMQEEYAYLRSRTDREIENAQYAYDEANRAYTRAMIDYRNSSSSTDLVTALMRLDRAETQLADAQEEFDNAQRIYEDISRNGTAQEKQAFRQTLSDAKKRLSAADKKYQSALSHYEEVLEESGDEEYGGGSRQDYENIRSLRNRTYEARKRLEEVQESQQEQLEAAARNMDEKEINNEISEIQRENQQQEKYRTDIRSSAEQQMILLDIRPCLKKRSSSAKSTE
ncbi:hypothetical protein D7X25_11525, partial [bacterium 1XD42-8]